MASDFLRKLAEEQAEGIRETFGKDAYGSTAYIPRRVEEEARQTPSSHQAERRGVTAPNTERTRRENTPSRFLQEQAAQAAQREAQVPRLTLPTVDSAPTSHMAARRTYSAPATERERADRRTYGLDTTLPEGRYTQVEVPEKTARRTVGDLLSDTDTMARWQELASKDKLTAEEKQEARAARREIDRAMRGTIRGTGWLPNMTAEEIRQRNELGNLNNALEVRSSVGSAFLGGVVSALGLDWLSDKIRDLGGEEYEEAMGNPPTMKELKAAAQAAAPGAFTAGNIAGNLAEMIPLSGAVGSALKGVEWFGKAAPWMQRAITSGITFGITGAQGALTEDKDLGGIALGAATGALSGAAGGALESFVGLGTSNALRRYGLQFNPIFRALAGGLSGAGFAAGSTTVQELSRYLQYPEGYTASPQQIGTDLAIAFLFSAVSSALAEAKSAPQNRESLLRMMDELAKEYGAAEMEMAGMTGEARRQTAQRVAEMTSRIRSSVATSRGMSGVSNEIKQLMAALDIIDDRMASIIAGGNGLLGAADVMQAAQQTGALPLALPSWSGTGSQGTNMEQAVQIIGANVPAPQGQAPAATATPAWYDAYQSSPRPIDQAAPYMPAIPASPAAQETANAPEQAATAPLAEAPQRGADGPTEGALTSENGGEYNALVGRPDVRWGGAGTTYTESNQPVEYTWAVVPANSLIVSNDQYGGVNPNYPAELQPRDRSRVSSQNQVQSMSRGLIPQKLADSPTAQNGSPIIRGDGVVISGNGRSAAITSAYQNGTAAEYEKFIRENAGRFGLDGTQLPEHPVLVRVAQNVEDWRGLAQELNVSSQASYSATEQAMADAQKMGDILDLLVPNDEGDINSPDNHEFIQAFVTGVVPPNERGDILTSGGLLSQRGLDRAENAIFAYAYGDPALLARYSEDLDSDMRNVTNALAQSAPLAAALQNAIEAGTAYNIPVRDTLLSALEIYSNARQEKKSVADYIRQGDLLRQADPWAEAIAGFIEKNKGSAKQLRMLFSSLFQEVLDYGDPAQGSMFGGDNYDLPTAIHGAAGRYGTASGKTLQLPEDSGGTGIRPGVLDADGRTAGTESLSPGGSHGPSSTPRSGADGEGFQSERTAGELTTPTAEADAEEAAPEKLALPSAEAAEEEEAPIRPSLPTAEGKAHEVLADALMRELWEGNTITSKRLMELADKAYGGSRGSGAYDMKTAYDVLELAVNKYLVDADFVKESNGDAATAMRTEKALEQLMKQLPTQTVRTEEQQAFQQFSTPPNIAYLAAWAANIGEGDVALEPSAGIGGLALWPKAWGATVYANELSGRRAEILRSLGLDEVFTENAEQINNILPERVKPTVVLMNPPFSSTAGRTNTNNTANAKRHVEQALLRLEDGGRLVAVLGRGMANDSKTFAPWWNELREKYDIRANLSIDGQNYTKYGTSFDVQMVVIDKTGPQKGETVTGEYRDLSEIPEALEAIRNDRTRTESGTDDRSERGLLANAGPERNGPVSARPSGNAERPAGGASGNVRVGSAGGTGDGGRVQPGGAGGDGLRNGSGADGRGVGGEGGGNAGSLPAESESERNDRPEPQLPGDGLSELPSYESVLKGLNKAVGRKPYFLNGKAYWTENVGDGYLAYIADEGDFDPEERWDLENVGYSSWRYETKKEAIQHLLSEIGQEYYDRYYMENFMEPGEKTYISDQYGTRTLEKPREDVPPQLPVIEEEAPARAPAAATTEAKPKRPKGGGTKAAANDDNVYAEYAPPRTPIKGAKKHPAKIVESAAMAAVDAPPATYVPNLPKELITSGALSDVQLTNIVYAGQAHSQAIPNQNKRKGYFIGDGTGVGKGRQLAGIILDNYRQGRKKAVWISQRQNLFSDAQRDWKALGMDPKDVISSQKVKATGKIGADSGIYFTTYDTLANKAKSGQSRIDQLVEWLGKDFDGVICFDEAHTMGNVLGKQGKMGKTKPAERALAGAKLQAMLPNARIVYASATMATNVDEMAFAERLGLWGPGTQFNNVRDFVDQISAGGMAAMELVARDMKAMGLYQARSISYDGVEYETLQHDLTPLQKDIYDTMSRAWQTTLQNMNEAMSITGANLNGRARAAARSAYYGALQRFYNQVLTSMAVPSVIQDMKKELSKGRSVVLQIVNTNEAETERQLAKQKESGESLEDLDITPREALLGFFRNSFPVQAYETYTDENGNELSRPVTDSEGNPVEDREAVKIRDRMIREIERMSVPEGPLEMIFDAFGTEAVAEVTGRGRRVVPGRDEYGNTIKIEEKRGSKSGEADAAAFQDGEKRILIFSDAGGTGKSYHADRTAKNQQQRVHYLLQPGWSAPKAVQGFGRTNRSNQASAPIYKLVTTDVKGQKRFVSTIARRLDQLGALTKGQRQTGSGMFSARDNLESDLATDSLYNFYRALIEDRIQGLEAESVLHKLGLYEKFYDAQARKLRVPDGAGRDMSLFLNRILALEYDEQNRVFDAFSRIFDDAYETALASGTLDMGMETVRADKIDILDDIIVREDENSGATTNYVQAKLSEKARILHTLDDLIAMRGDFIGLYRKKNGEAVGVFRTRDKTEADGSVVKQYILQTPLERKISRYVEKTLKEECTSIPRKKWETAWAEEVEKAPEYTETVKHMLTGSLLPIWKRLPKSGNVKVQRLIADDGRQYLGRIIDPKQIDGVLKSLGVSQGRTQQSYNADDVIRRVFQNGDKATLTDNRITLTRRRVGNEWRIELNGDNLYYLAKTIPGILTENINYRERYFIPNGEKQKAVLEAVLADNPVRDIETGRGEALERAEAAPKHYDSRDQEYMAAVESGNIEKARYMVQQAAKEAGFSDAIPEQTLTYKTRTGRPPRKTVKVYKVFTLADDGSPTALFVSGTVKLPQGVWLDAQDTWHFLADNGNYYVPSTQNPYTDGGKTGAQVTIPTEDVRNELIRRGFLPKNSKAKKITALAYRPGWHAGNLPFFPQGGMKRDGSNYENIHRWNQVVFECEMDADYDYTEDARAQAKARNKDGSVNLNRADLQEMPTGGYYEYSTNPLTKGGKRGTWFISGSLKINRALTQEECDKLLEENGFLPQEWEQGTMNLADLGYTGTQNDSARKTLAPITYDDDGKVIPLSERFNREKDDIRYNRESGTANYNGNDMPRHPENWTAERVGDKSKKPMSLPDIVNMIRQKFDIPISTGNIRSPQARAQYHRQPQSIRSKVANSIPDIAHELGHHLDNLYSISGRISKAAKDEIVNAMPDDFKAKYKDKKQLPGEGVGEFLRRYLQNRETAEMDCPIFSNEFFSMLSAKERATLDKLADEVNAYYSLSQDTGNWPVHNREDRGRDYRDMGEKLKDLNTRFRTLFIDSMEPIKRIDEATGGKVHLFATNSAYAGNRAYAAITGDLYDLRGNPLGDGLQKVLKGIHLNNKREFSDFGMYLICRHGPERLAEGMRVFADDAWDSTAWMEARADELAEKYPQFEEAADRLEDFQKRVLQDYGVDSGLYSQETVDAWYDRWEHYVPLNRWFGDKDGSAKGQKRGFANQTGPYRKAVGSGRDIINPVDNILENTVRLITTSIYNDVMQKITREVAGTEGLGWLMEKVPMPLARKTWDGAGLKSKTLDAFDAYFTDAGKSLDEKQLDLIQTILDGAIDDLLVQYGRGKAHGDIVTVLVDGKPQYWKVNDPDLLRSITNMGPSRVPSFLNYLGRINRFITGNITGMNVVWSVASNMPRDIGTMFTFSKTKNVVKLLAGIVESYVNSFRGDKAGELFKEFMAMGGNSTSAQTADKDMAKKARKALQRHAADYLNPLEWVEFVSDMIERGPRYSYYKICRTKYGMTPEEAFYAAGEITVNFKRAGLLSREINMVIPFFNASVQGVDRAARWLAADEAPKENRNKVRAGRITAFVGASLAIAALSMFLNTRTKKKREDLEKLSNFTKNTYFVIPLKNGKYLAIPKPRELAIPISLFERIMETYLAQNPHAMDDFWEYATDNLLPGVISGAAQGDLNSAIGDLGVAGTIHYLVANQDFLGRPIVSSALQKVEPRDQYNDSTSQLARLIGQAFNLSPQQIDFIGNDIMGGFWSWQKALFPVSGKGDLSLGVKSKWVKDPLYSTDIANRMYDERDRLERVKNSHPGDVNAAIEYRTVRDTATFYGQYYRLARNEEGLGEDAKSREIRTAVLDMILGVERGEKADEGAYRFMVEALNYAGNAELMPAVQEVTVKADSGKVYNLTSEEYFDLQTRYLSLYYNYVRRAMDRKPGMSLDEKVSTLEAAKRIAGIVARGEAVKAHGGKSKDYQKILDLREDGVDVGELVSYLAAKDQYSADGKVTNAEILGAVAGLRLPTIDEQAALVGYSDESLGLKLRSVGEFDVDARDYQKVLNALGDANLSQDNAVAAIDEVYGPTTNANRAEKAAMWQALDKGWKASNNPYDVGVSETVKNRLTLPVA